ncbi:MAG TPA: phosphohydrolase [Syntrophobacteraceae bacterium]|nr:phosphohydrolase [Syntrophobacteraceae bacterium]
MKCPGQDSRFWQPGAIFEAQCPHCSHAVEFFKDESTRKCKNCGQKFVNPKMDFGCASYCKFAEQCLGELTPELLAKREDLLKDRVAIEMKKHFQRDFRRIARSTKVARYAEEIVRNEGGDPAVVLCAAYLLDVGAQEVHSLDQETGAGIQRHPNTETAREILARLNARPELISEVCDIIADQDQPQTNATSNAKVVHDANTLTDLEEKIQANPEKAAELGAQAAGRMLTESGRSQAKNLLKL